MAAKKDNTTAYLQKRIKDQEAKINELTGAVYEITRSMDAVLYEICKKYGKDGQIEIGIPKVDGATKIVVARTDDTYTITPVTVQDGKEE